MPLGDLIMMLGAFVVGGWLLHPIAKAVAERLRGGRTNEQELTALRMGMLAELQQTRHELAELHERVDFAERLLARPRDGAPRPPAG